MSNNLIALNCYKVIDEKNPAIKGRKYRTRNNACISGTQKNKKNTKNDLTRSEKKNRTRNMVAHKISSAQSDVIIISTHKLKLQRNIYV